MLVLQTLELPTSNVWYLAYGSNLAASKFIHDRGIIPLSTAVVTVPGWRLALDSAGVPYSEPSFASISPIGPSDSEKVVEVIGTAYLVTPEMYTKVIASEGGGIAYAEVALPAKFLSNKGSDEERYKNPNVAVRSLITVLRREAKPSVRYMSLVREGASEAQMPQPYQVFLENIPTYHPIPTRRAHMGASIFLALWVPIMSLMERITKSSLQRNGSAYAPIWIIYMVRFVVRCMWYYHDYIHAPIWGRGDGLHGGCSQMAPWPVTDV